jgi:hypothetical protein
MKCIIKVIIISIFLVAGVSSSILAWSSKTHMFIAHEAGMANPVTACFPDFSRNEEYNLLVPYHWHDAAPDAIVTPEYIDRYQISEGTYTNLDFPGSPPIKIRVPDPCGVLYWEIVELYKNLKGSTTQWEYDYYLSNIAHYVGDLSQPLHNSPYGSSPAGDGKIYPELGKWNEGHHTEFDNALDSVLPLRAEKRRSFQKMMAPIKISTTDDLKVQISKVANSSIGLANKCYSQKRIIAEDEALKQVAMSVSLLRAIMKSTKQ